LARLTQSHQYVTEAIKLATDKKHQNLLVEFQQDIENLCIELLNSNDNLTFNSIVIRSETINKNLGPIFALVDKNQKELNSKIEDDNNTNNEALNVSGNNTETVKIKHNVNPNKRQLNKHEAEIPIKTPPEITTNVIHNKSSENETVHKKTKSCFYKRYTESVKCTEEELRDSIATSILDHPDRAR